MSFLGCWQADLDAGWAGEWLFAAAVAAKCAAAGINACFVHMNMSWAYRLRAWLGWLHVPIIVWYAHPARSLRLRLALVAARKVVTSVPQAFPFSSPKVTIIGQGIDTNVFTISARSQQSTRLCHVGRLTPIKGLELLIRTFACLCQRFSDVDYRLDLIGEAATRSDERFVEHLHRVSADLRISNRISFLGVLPQAEISKYYSTVFLQVNFAGPIHSWDKTVLEALSCGCPAATRNRAFNELLAPFPTLRLDPDWGPEQLADRLHEVYQDQATFDPAALRGLVDGQHDLRTWTSRVLEVIKEAQSRE